MTFVTFDLSHDETWPNQKRAKYKEKDNYKYKYIYDNDKDDDEDGVKITTVPAW